LGCRAALFQPDAAARDLRFSARGELGGMCNLDSLTPSRKVSRASALALSHRLRDELTDADDAVGAPIGVAHQAKL
jgi:hypothetical protein